MGFSANGFGGFGLVGGDFRGGGGCVVVAVDEELKGGAWYEREGGLDK